MHRQILLLDRARHRVRFAVESGIVEADSPLELRELAHHLGEQVRLCECRRARGGLDLDAEFRGQLARERLDPL